ncbi:MAG: four helix bundle protein [Planctomycetes bacterium]|nr:four helix bundle protein [Planctomycetota bacterium]
MGFLSYKDLEIYKLAHKLAVEVHQISLTLPKFELYEEGSQIRRASKSISANIVEGFGRRRYKAEFIKYLVYAHSSCDETIEHIELLKEIDSLKNKDDSDKFIKEYDKLARMLNKFIQSVEKGHLV